MSFCSNCGAEMNEGTAFCPSCGAAQVQQTNASEPEVITTAPVAQQNPEAAGALTGPAKIMSLISMICGLVSLVSCYGGFVPGIAAIILSVMASKKAPGVANSKAKIGMITGIIGIIVSVICFIAYIVLVAFGAIAEANFAY